MASCASTDDYSAQRKRLADAHKDLAGGSLEEVERRVDRMLVDTSEDASLYVLQRFHAACLAAEAHTQASFGSAFLMEKGVPDLLRSGAANPSIPGHLVAAGFYASHALQWSAKASKAKAVVDGEALLPPSLAPISVAQATGKASYVLIYTLSRLRFDDRLASLLDGQARLASYETVEEELESTGVPAGARPWIYLALFDWLKDDDAAGAFQYAISVVQQSARMPGSMERIEVERAARWLTDNEEYVFLCPNDDNEIVPSGDICPACGDARSRDFIRRPREGS